MCARSCACFVIAVCKYAWMCAPRARFFGVRAQASFLPPLGQCSVAHAPISAAVTFLVHTGTCLDQQNAQGVAIVALAISVKWVADRSRLGCRTSTVSPPPPPSFHPALPRFFYRLSVSNHHDSGIRVSLPLRRLGAASSLQRGRQSQREVWES